MEDKTKNFIFHYRKFSKFGFVFQNGFHFRSITLYVRNDNILPLSGFFITKSLFFIKSFKTVCSSLDKFLYRSRKNNNAIPRFLTVYYRY